jgi:allantoin racemase
MIVIINPNATVTMTDAMVDTARKAAPNSNIVGWTSIEGPPADSAGAKAIIIGCFDDTGLSEARSLASCPVIGIGQAAYHLASLYGSRFSVVTTLDVSVPILEANIKAYGLDANLARVRASGVPVLALDDDRERATQVVKEEIRTAIREDSINSVVLGCAGMVHITDDRGDTSFKLIDGVHAAVCFASML